MSKTHIGDLCAHLPNKEKKYVRIGSAFRDDDGRISIKIDTLPLPGDAWQGWANIFDQPRREKPPVSDDDVPF